MSAFISSDVYGVGARFTLLTTSGTIEIEFIAGGAGGGIPAPDGTFALPEGFNFTNELGLGFYRLAAGTIGATGNVATRATDATSGGTLHQSPTFSLFATAWDGAASQLVEWGLESEPVTDTEGRLNFFLRTTLGTFVSMRLSNDTATPGSDLDLFDGRVRCAELFSTFHLDTVINGGNLAQRLDVPAAANNTAIQQLLLKDSTGAFASKDVNQGAADSAGVGFRALVVPNDATQTTAVVAGDWALDGNWGAGASITVAAGSTCRRGACTITAAGAPSPAAGATLTFPTAFAATPFAGAWRTDGNNPPEITSMSVKALASTTTLVLTTTGASSPTAGTAYDFTWMVME